MITVSYDKNKLLVDTVNKKGIALFFKYVYLFKENSQVPSFKQEKFIFFLLLLGEG